MPHSLDQAVQNAYSDLYAACLTPAFDGKGVSFVRKNIKGQRYIDQARQLLDVLLDIRPGSVSVAVEAARQAGAKFHRQYKKALTRLPADLQLSLREWTT